MNRMTVAWILRLLLPAAVVAAALGLEACSPPPPDGKSAAALASGWEQFRMGDYPGAIAAFAALERSQPANSPLRQKALYGRGMATWLNTSGGSIVSNGARAKPLLEAAAAGKADPDTAAWSALALARMPHLAGGDRIPDYPAVRAGYNQVYERFPNHPAGQEARLYAIGLRLVDFAPGEAEAALRELDAFDRDHPASAFSTSALSIRELCCDILNRPADQVAVRKELIARRKQNPRLPQTGDLASMFWALASIAEFRAGDFATARTYYRMIPTEYDVDLRTWPAKRALERMDRMEKEIAATPAPQTGAAHE